VVVAIDDVAGKKVAMLDAHTSQMYEWLPWHDGNLDQVPKDPQARKEWLSTRYAARGKVTPALLEELKKWYGAQADSIKAVEAFEICEYGQRPPREQLLRLFPFFPESPK
jgi:hypothetical protein